MSTRGKKYFQKSDDYEDQAAFQINHLWQAVLILAAIYFSKSEWYPGSIFEHDLNFPPRLGLFINVSLHILFIHIVV